MDTTIRPTFAKPNKKLIFPNGELTKENLGDLCRIFDALRDYNSERFGETVTDWEELTVSGDPDFTGLMSSPAAPFIRMLLENSDTYLSLMSLLYGVLVGELPDNEIHRALVLLDTMSEIKNDPNMSKEDKDQAIRLLKLAYPHHPESDPYKKEFLNEATEDQFEN